MSKLVDTRLCRFAVPDSWSVLPGQGAVGPDLDHPTLSALAVEDWLDEPIGAATFLERQMPLLQEELGGVEQLRLDTANDSRFDSAAVALFRSRDAQGPAMLHYQYVGIVGFLVACLTVTGEEQDHERWRPEASSILGSLEVPQGRKLRALTRRQDLIATRSPTRDSARVPIPHLQLGLPRLAGWQLDEAAGVFQRGAASLKLRPGGHGADSVDQLFAQALADAAKSPTWHPAWWEKGELPDGRSFFALATERCAPKTWGPPERTGLLRIFVQDCMPVELQAVAPALDADLTQAVGSLLSGYAWLPPEQRRCRSMEPWLPVELDGPWTNCGPGAYLLLSEPPAFICLSAAPRTDSFRQHAQTQAALLRGSPEVPMTAQEELCHGRWRRWEACRYALDAPCPDGSAGVLRACWLEVGREVYGLVVQGTSRAEVDALLLRLLEAFEPGADSSGADRWS